MSSCFDYESAKLIVQVVGYIGGWVAIVIGWKVSWGQALKREERKELRDLVDRLILLCHATEKASIDFLTKDLSTDNGSAAHHIRGDLSRLSRALSRLKTERGFDCTSEVVAFRRAITGGEFESASRKAIDRDSEALRGVTVASLNLVDKIESEYSRLIKSS